MHEMFIHSIRYYSCLNLLFKRYFTKNKLKTNIPAIECFEVPWEILNLACQKFNLKNYCQGSTEHTAIISLFRHIAKSNIEGISEKLKMSFRFPVYALTCKKLESHHSPPYNFENFWSKAGKQEKSKTKSEKLS